MLKGKGFAQVYETSHGQLLVYTEHRAEAHSILHQVMRFGDAELVAVEPIIGTRDEIKAIFNGYCRLEAERVAMLMSKAHERWLDGIEADTSDLGGSPLADDRGDIEDVTAGLQPKPDDVFEAEVATDGETEMVITQAPDDEVPPITEDPFAGMEPVHDEGIPATPFGMHHETEAEVAARKDDWRA